MQAWTGKQAGDLWDSTTGTINEHRGVITTGMVADGAGQTLDLRKASMAQRAQLLSQTSDDALTQMLTQLQNGDPAAGRSAVTAVTAADDAGSLAAKAETLGKVGRFGGPIATAGLAAYVNWSDWEHGQKSGWAAVANTAGTTAGDIGGAWVGAETGAAAGGAVALAFPPAELVAVPVGAVVGAVLGGLGGGSLGGWLAEKPFK